MFYLYGIKSKHLTHFLSLFSLAAGQPPFHGAAQWGFFFEKLTRFWLIHLRIEQTKLI